MNITEFLEKYREAQTSDNPDLGLDILCRAYNQERRESFIHAALAGAMARNHITPAMAAGEAIRAADLVLERLAKEKG